MNIHEFQARELFGKFAVATQPGGVASTPEEAERVASSLGGSKLVGPVLNSGGSTAACLFSYNGVYGALNAACQ